MPTVTFVILHYMAIKVTVNCITSILNKITYSNYKIVVVDNGSSNNTGKEISNMYKENPNISVICLDDNLGFSAGNNIGYTYAKETLFSDYIIVINNDTEMIQEDFIQKAIVCYESTPYYVLGPDIINLEGMHQNPIRDHIITREETQRWLTRQYLVKRYLNAHKRLRLPLTKFYSIMMQIIKIKKRKKVRNEQIQTNVSLYGACFVFSPRFVQNNSFAFEEASFMYGEEELLSLRCQSKNWLTLYNPELQIFHVEKAVTRYAHPNLLDKEIFTNDNMIKAIKAILKKMDE